MDIKHGWTRDGGFIAYVPGTNLADYAYPTSHYASKAKRRPNVTAKSMIDHLVEALPAFVSVSGYDRLVEWSANLHAEMIDA